MAKTKINRSRPAIPSGVKMLCFKVPVVMISRVTAAVKRRISGGEILCKSDWLRAAIAEKLERERER